MPVLTRSAAKQLKDVTPAAEHALALRESVTQKAQAVWTARGDIDVYTGSNREATETPQVDHVLEVQLAEMSLVRAYKAERAGSDSIATLQATEMMRDALNSVSNLNVTSTRVNQSKRGPVTAALNRLNNERLRTVPLEQLARQGKASWLVDEGIWARIEREIVVSYDTLDEELRGGGVDALPAAAALVNGSFDELATMLSSLKLI